jgi:hypothetical protein
MKHLNKTNSSKILSENLSYDKQSDRPKIKETLKKEQYNFCAYSKRHLQETDEVHIEHFDGRLKGTSNDSYYNWYAVLAWMNSHKAKKIEKYLPIIQPHEINNRIIYKKQLSIYTPKEDDDIEAQNLIDYLGLNKYEVYTDRNNHIYEAKQLFEMCNNNINQLKDFLKYNRKNLSFYTALEVELEIDLSDLIF